MNFFDMWKLKGAPKYCEDWMIVWEGQATFVIARETVGLELPKMKWVPNGDDLAVESGVHTEREYRIVRKSDGKRLSQISWNSLDDVLFAAHEYEIVLLEEAKQSAQNIAPNPAPRKVSNHDLVRRLGQHIPDFYARTTCPNAGCTTTNGIYELVQHLNDTHLWERERIADWLETLDLDLTVHQEDVREYKPRPILGTLPSMKFVADDSTDGWTGSKTLGQATKLEHHPDGSITATMSMDSIDPEMVKMVTEAQPLSVSLGTHSVFDEQLSDEAVKKLAAALEIPKPILTWEKDKADFYEPIDWAAVADQIEAGLVAVKHMAEYLYDALNEITPKIKDFLDSLPAELAKAAEAKIQENKKEEKDEH